MTIAARDRSTEVFVTERPWGQFEQFVSNESCTVKIITVEPGHRLSLQTHGLRDEMWQVLDVPIDIQVDDRSWTAQVGERIWVPQGAELASVMFRPPEGVVPITWTGKVKQLGDRGRPPVTRNSGGKGG